MCHVWVSLCVHVSVYVCVCVCMFIGISAIFICLSYLFSFCNFLILLVSTVFIMNYYLSCTCINISLSSWKSDYRSPTGYCTNKWQCCTLGSAKNDKVQNRFVFSCVHVYCHMSLDVRYVGCTSELNP